MTHSKNVGDIPSAGVEWFYLGDRIGLELEMLATQETKDNEKGGCKMP